MGLSLDAVLLLVLSLPIPLTYALLPGGVTPYWLFGIYFFLLVTYVLIDQNLLVVLKQKQVETWKYRILWACIGIVAGGALYTAVVQRLQTAPEYGAHDIILQLESAMRYVLEGKNPYSATYFGTPMEKFGYEELGKPAENPALYHFVMPPFYLLFHFLAYVPMVSITGAFDARVVTYLAFAGTLIVFAWWSKQFAARQVLLILTAFNPVTFKYLLEGRSDQFAFFWLVLALFLLDRRRFLLSAIVFGLALLSKQTIWFAAPFFGWWLWLQGEKSKRRIALCVGSIVAVILLFTGPFLLWDAKALFDSTIGFLQGSTPHSYPVAGYGFSMILWQMGLLKDIHAYYPFGILQAVIGLPVLVALLRWFSRKPGPSRFFLAYGLFLFVIWYFSRYFHNSHLGYLSVLFVAGFLFPV